MSKERRRQGLRRGSRSVYAVPVPVGPGTRGAHIILMVAPCPTLSTALEVAHESSCPTARWLDVLAPKLFGEANLPPRAAVLFNVGSNKGYAIASMLQRFGLLRGNSTVWHEALRMEIIRSFPKFTLDAEKRCKRTSMCPYSCGVCDACKEPAPPLLPVPVRTVALHAFEMQEPNVNWLSHALHRFAAPSPSAAVSIVHAVVSDRDGEACMLSAGAARPAMIGIEQAQSIRPRGKNATFLAAELAALRRPCTKLPQLRLDSYMAAQRIERVALVSIDAEGHDALVLDGMAEALTRGAVDVLEFEYHHIGEWSRRSLKSTVDWLHTIGYACFWQSRAWRERSHGRSVTKVPARCELAAVSGECWSPEFEIRAWSNLVCARGGAKHQWPQSELWRIAQQPGCGHRPRL